MTQNDIPDLVVELAAKQFRQQVAWRRQLHQKPEISFEEFETTSFLKKQVKQMGLKQLPIKMKTGLLAQLNGKHKGPTIAIRTDIDALPVTERSELPFASKIPGKMHACGHDVHMATVLGTARLLTELKDQIHGSVRFIFQPAEEMPPGGAGPMIDNGALDDVKMIFGLHVDPHIATGKIGLRDGITMAAVIDFDLIIKGTGGHAARPHLAVDAITAAAEVIESLQKIVSRETDPVSPTVITFGKIQGGTARNVIADQVILTGTARTLSKEVSKKIPRLIKRTAEGICRARGAKAELNLIANYPTLSNHASANKILAANYKRLFGPGRIIVTDQTLGGEDFARYLSIVPGAMFRLGIKNKKVGSGKPWHSPYFKVDEECLKYGTALLAQSALDCLSGTG